jgi:DnaK suppressor protein
VSTREELLRLRAGTGAEVTSMEGDLAALFEASRSSNADDEHDPEGTTIAFERAQLSAVLAAARRRIAELDDALARLDAGSYGVCEVCGQAIPVERMQARPAARSCVGCVS